MVKELAQFLREQAIPKLVRDLQAVEGVPTDSESLSQAFHSHGINLRYLGEVYEAIKEKELNHLKTLIERDAIMRSAKHLINAELRETSDTYLSAVIAHLLNLLVAPLSLLDKLNDGSIRYPSATPPAFDHVTSSSDNHKTSKQQESEQKPSLAD